METALEYRAAILCPGLELNVFAADERGLTRIKE
jgi:hypothetical protein